MSTYFCVLFKLLEEADSLHKKKKKKLRTKQRHMIKILNTFDRTPLKASKPNSSVPLFVANIIRACLFF